MANIEKTSKFFVDLFSIFDGNFDIEDSQIGTIIYNCDQDKEKSVDSIIFSNKLNPLEDIHIGDEDDGFDEFLESKLDLENEDKMFVFSLQIKNDDGHCININRIQGGFDFYDMENIKTPSQKFMACFISVLTGGLVYDNKLFVGPEFDSSFLENPNKFFDVINKFALNFLLPSSKEFTDEEKEIITKKLQSKMIELFS